MFPFSFQSGAHDFNLLTNLLAESQGFPESLRILALFEHQFSMLWEPTNIRLLQKQEFNNPDLSSKEKEMEAEGISFIKKPQTLLVSWDDAEIADYFHK